MARHWRVMSARANAEGNLLTVGFEVWDDTTPFTALPNIVETSKTIDLDKFGRIIGWRFDDSQTRVFEVQPSLGDEDQHVEAACLIEWQLVSNRVQFKAAIGLNRTGRIAPENAQGQAALSELMQGWVTLAWGGTPSDAEAPRMTHDCAAGQGEPILAFDSYPVGRAATNRLVFGVDSVGEWVGRDATAQVSGVNPLQDRSLLFNSLTKGGSTPPDLINDGGTSGFYIPRVRMNDDESRYALDNPPPVTANATICAVFKPGSEAVPATVVGRYNGTGSDRSWRLYYDNTSVQAPKIVYEARSASGGVSVDLDVNYEDPVVLVVFRRDDAGNWRAWVNGITSVGTLTYSDVVQGGGPLTIGARITSGSTWGEGFNGQINQVAVYDASLDGRKVSLVLHQMATRAGLMLGTPIPSEFQEQPWTDPEDSHRRLDRKPIALITLQNSDFVDNNVFGQSPKWRPNPMNQGAVEAWLRERIQEILTAGDDYEIMFNRPGGKYEEDIVPSYVFGWSPATLPAGAQKMILHEQWAAMRNTWTAFNLTHYNDLPTVHSGELRARRAWFYTGGGMPLNDDGTLNNHGYMFNRSIGPSTPGVYKAAILDAWLAQDPNEDPDLQRFRCLFVDAASRFYGQHVQVVHDSEVNEAFTLVGEAIPNDDGARLAAPWFSLVRFASAPWWNNNKKERRLQPVLVAGPQRATGVLRRAE